MTLEELNTLLNTASLPVAFDHFKEPQRLPYIVYIVAGNDTEAADNVAWSVEQRVQVELYSDNKDQALEETVENILSGFYFEKDEGYLTDDEMYMVTYTFSLI